MSDHRIAWKIEQDSVWALIVCEAPIGAMCRAECPEGCPEWPCGHELVYGGDCNAVEFIDISGAVESYGGTEEPLRDGPVEVEWNGDYYTWTYSSATPSSTGDPESG